MTEPRWLDDDQQRAWRALIAVLLKLPNEFDSQLQRDADLTHFEYWVIALLSEAPDRALRLSQLAEQANASLSRLSHVVTRLERRGFLARRRCPDDARATLAELTEAGWQQVLATAPGHVETVQRLVFDALDTADVHQLERLCTSILNQIERVDGPPAEPPRATGRPA